MVTFDCEKIAWNYGIILLIAGSVYGYINNTCEGDINDDGNLM